MTGSMRTYKRLGPILILAESGRAGDALVVDKKTGLARRTMGESHAEIVGTLGEDAYQGECIDACEGARWYRTITKRGG